MENDELTPILIKETHEMDMPMTAESIKALRNYANLLKEWNKVMNLTNVDDDSGIAVKHFVDSLTLVPFVNDEQKRAGKKELSLIDVGTGAGFPGIPVKVALPELQVTLLDSLAKRIKFLEAVIEKDELTNIECVHSRAEDAGRDRKYREKYDIATARAVASLPVLCEYCLPFVKVGGVFLAMKGHLEEELEEADKAIRLLGGKIEKVDRFTLPSTDMVRSVVVVRKIKETPKAFPRQAGKPSKEPLK